MLSNFKGSKAIMFLTICSDFGSWYLMKYTIAYYASLKSELVSIFKQANI